MPFTAKKGKARRASKVSVLRRPPWVLAVPGLLLLLAVHFLAPAAGAGFSLTSWNGFSAARYIGLQNFRDIFASAEIRGAIFHTLILAGAYVVLVNITGLTLALALNRTLKSRNLLRTLFFAPVVLSPLSVSYIWQYLFNFDGPINMALAGLGLESWRNDWLGSPIWALWAILVVMVWQHAGQAMIIYLAGLQAVADEYEEAAIMDGAGLWMRLRRVVFPLLAPAFTIVTTLMLIMGLRVFDQVFILTGGGPVNATQTLVTEVYQQTWVNGQFGFGASIALVTTVLITVLGVANVLVLRRRERRMS